MGSSPDERLLKVYWSGFRRALPGGDPRWRFDRYWWTARLMNLDRETVALLASAWARFALPLLYRYSYDLDGRTRRAVNLWHQAILNGHISPSYATSVTSEIAELVAGLHFAGHAACETVLFLATRAARNAAESLPYEDDNPSARLRCLTNAFEAAEDAIDAVSAESKMRYGAGPANFRSVESCWQWVYATYLRAAGPADRTFDRRWASETAVALARGISLDCAFDRMPILADALEEAGCDRAGELALLRGEDPGFTAADWWLRRLLYRPEPPPVFRPSIPR